MEVVVYIVEYMFDVELKMKFGEIEIKGLLVDFGENIYLVKVNGCYVVLIEVELILFEKGVFLIEFYKLGDLYGIIEKISSKKWEE